MTSMGWWIFGEVLSAGAAFLWGRWSYRRGYSAGYRHGSRIGQAASEVLGQVRAAFQRVPGPVATHRDVDSTYGD